METPPATIGPYEIQREIGRGGMGMVYLAREREGGRIVALKVLPKEFTSDPVRLKRFRREAGALASVRHANIVPVYGVGEEGGVHFIAMKYIEGTSLDILISARHLRRAAREEKTVELARGGVAQRPLNDPKWVCRAVRTVEKIAHALAHLHERGIVHRDVKPGNILVDRHGEPWLVDFGLVRDAGKSTVSGDDGILGTVQYTAPEQIERGRWRPDHRSDLYSLGVTLYELVTLQRPFDGGTTGAILYAVAHEKPVSPKRANPDISEDLERVIQKAMAKQPANRYDDGAAFAEDLRRVRTFKPVRARPPAFSEIRQLCSRNPVMAWALVFVLLCLVGMIEYAVDQEVADRRQRIDCRREADLAFGRGQFRSAAEGYRMFLRLGGNDVDTIDRISFCRDQERLEGSRPEPR